MQTNLKIFLILSSFLILISVFRLLRKNKLPIKYSLVWIFPCLVVILFVLFPEFIINITNLFGFDVTSSFIMAIFIGILLFITMALTVIVSSLRARMQVLIQEIALLKEKIK